MYIYKRYIGVNRAAVIKAKFTTSIICIRYKYTIITIFNT